MVMKYLLVKLRRDILSMWPQFLSVFLMAMLAITVYAGMEGVWYGLRNVVDEYYEQSHLADAWVYGSSVSEDQMDAVRRLEGVVALSSATTAQAVYQGDDEQTAMLQLNVIAEESLFQPYQIEGDAFSPTAEGIWLDRDFAAANGIEAGDMITLELSGQATEQTVRGLILHAEYIYYTGAVTATVPNHELYGYAVLSQTAAEKAFPFLPVNTLRLDLEEDSDLTALQEKIERILDDDFSSFVAREDLATASQITKEIQQMQNMSEMFSAVFIVLVLLCIYTTMSRMVNVQTKQIGTLKALGFSDAAIRGHYMLYGVVVSLVGSLLGIVLGTQVISRAVMKIKQATLALPEWRIHISPITYLLCVCIVLCCLLSTLLATRKRLNRMPAETLRGTFRKKERTKATADIFAGKRLPFGFKWVFRDGTRNKLRWLMGIIGVAGSMMLLIAGVGLRDSINYSNEYVFRTQYAYEQKILLSSLTDEEAQSQLEAVTGDDVQYIMEQSVELSHGTDQALGVLIVQEQGDFLRYETMEGEAVDPSRTGVLINRKIAKDLALERGDRFRIRSASSGGYIQATVAAVIKSPSPQGIYVSRELYEDLGGSFTPTAALTDHAAANAQIEDLSFVRDTVTPDQQLADMQKLTKSVMSIVYFLIAGSILLSVVILYNLGMLNFVERTKEYATMKVLGFYQKEIRRIVGIESVIILLVGLILGIPLGLWFLRTYIGIIQFKSFEWVPTLNTWSLVFAVCLLAVTTQVVNAILAGKIKRIVMAQSLKSTD